jgi:hypothetical protein
MASKAQQLTSEEEALLLQVGGKKIKKGRGAPVWNFGLIQADDYTREQSRQVEEVVEETPRLEIEGRSRSQDPGVKAAYLFELWKHPTVNKALGFDYPGTHQLTGSCVGAGGGNALASLIFADVLKRGDPEQCVVPFWLLPYGRSRFYLGDRGKGEGSTGSTFAKAVNEDGTLDATQKGLPEFKNTDGLIWGSSVEYSWSDGDAQQTMDLLPQSKKHLVKSVAKCKDHNDVREAIINGYPVTIASGWGGLMKCPTEGDPPVLLSKRTGSWSHQMSVQAWWDHPTLGEIFWIHNQWGLETHGRCPSGAPGGGFWVKKAEIDWICRDEAYAFSQFDGFPAPDWDIPWLF